MTDAPEAMLVQSEVLQEAGAWVVYLEVWFTDGIERRRIGAYRSEHKARIAARWRAGLPCNPTTSTHSHAMATPS